MSHSLQGPRPSNLWCLCEKPKEQSGKLRLTSFMSILWSVPLWKWIKEQHLWTVLAMSLLPILSPRPDSMFWLPGVKVLPGKLVLKAVRGPLVQGLPHLHCQISSKCRCFISWGQGVTASRGCEWSIWVEKMPNSTYVSVERGQVHLI